MKLTITDRDLRELLIRRAALVIQLKCACQLRAKKPNKISLNTLYLLRNLIDEAEEKILEFQQNYG